MYLLYNVTYCASFIPPEAGLLHMYDYNLFSFDLTAAVNLKSCNSLLRKFSEIHFFKSLKEKV